MSLLAGHRLGVAAGAVGQLTLAGKGLFLDSRHTVQGRGQGDDLENGAGHIGGLDEPIQINAVVGSRRVRGNVRHILRVVGRSSQGAENFTGFVVIHRHGSLSAAHGLQGGVLHLGRERQPGSASLAGSIVHAVDPVVACHGSCVSGNRRGVDKAVPVAQPVKRRLPGLGIVGVSSALGDAQKGLVAPVGDGAAADVAAVI